MYKIAGQNYQRKNGGGPNLSREEKLRQYVKIADQRSWHLHYELLLAPTRKLGGWPIEKIASAGGWIQIACRKCGKCSDWQRPVPFAANWANLPSFYKLVDVKRAASCSRCDRHYSIVRIRVGKRVREF